MRDVTGRLWTRDFILIWAVHFILSLAFHATMPAFPLLLQDRFGLSGLAMGAAAASYTLSAIMTRPPSGYCLDRFGRRVLYIPSYCLFALVYCLYPLATDAVSVTLIRFSHGAVWGTVMGAANTAAVDLLPSGRQGEGIGYFGLAMILSMAAGPGIGLWALETFGFDVLFNGAALLTLAGFAFALRLRFPVIPRSRQALSLASVFERTSLPASLAVLIFCIPYGAVNNYSGLFARSIPGASTGVFFLLLAVGTGVTRLFSGYVFDRGGPGLIMRYAYAILLAGCLLMVLAGLSPGFGAYCFNAAGLFIGLGYGIAVPVVQAMINALVPAERRGAANSTMMTAFDFGICLGLLTTSSLHWQAGVSGTYAALAGCICVSALIFFLAVLPRYSRDLRDSRRERFPKVSRG